LSCLVWCRMSPLTAGEWPRWSVKIPSSPHHHLRDSLSLPAPHRRTGKSPPSRAGVPLPRALAGLQPGQHHATALCRARFISKGWGKRPSESRNQLERGSAVAGDRRRSGPPRIAAAFVPLFENKEEGSQRAALPMELPARPDASSSEEKAPSGSRAVAAVAGVRSQRWEISCRGAGRASGAGEEPAMVSGGDVFSFMPPAPILQRQPPLTRRPSRGETWTPALRPQTPSPQPLRGGMG